jgi:hypothetical protein
MAMAQVKRNDRTASATVSTSRSPISSALGRWYSRDSPRLPPSRFCIHLRYCTASGRSSPYCRRRASTSSALMEVPDDASVAV